MIEFIDNRVEGKTQPFKKEGIEWEQKGLKEKKKSFRLTGKKLFLTYSKTSISKEECLLQLSVILNNSIKDYIITQEKSSADGGRDLHVYLNLTKKVNIISTNKLDLKLDSGEKVHGRYETVRNKEDVIHYIRKSGDFITNLFNSSDIYVELYRLAKEESIDAAMKYLESVRPEWICTRFKNIRSNLECYIKSNSKKAEPVFSIENFNYPKEVLNWLEHEKDTKTLVLIGSSGFGKTEGMITLLENYNPMLIKDLNKLGDLNSKIKAIILDDTNWEKVDKETILGLTDKTRPYDLRILYKTVEISNTLIKVILLNNDKFDYSEDDPISRRIRKIFLKSSMINISNVSITNNLNISLNCEKEKEKKN
jgi:hypothetical protein